MRYIITLTVSGYEWYSCFCNYLNPFPGGVSRLIDNEQKAENYRLYDEEKVRAIAEQGSELVRRLSNDSRKVSNYYKRQAEKG